MDGLQRRQLLVSKAWIQAVVLVVLVRVLHPRPARLPHVHGAPAGARARRRPAGPRALHGQGHLQGPAGLPAQRADGVRVGVRPRRLPRARTSPPTTCAARRTSSALLRRPALGLRRAPDDRGLPHQPLRRAHEDADASRAARRRRSARSCRTTAASSPTRRPGTACGPTRSPTATQLRQLTAFFAWTAWAASTNRPGHDYSYTNNWPPEPRVDNKPTANVIVWSVLSLIALLGGIGMLFGAFGRWGRRLGWHGREQATLSFRAPGRRRADARRSAPCAWFFFVMAALFLIQTLVGAASQHYRAEIDDFFGFDLAQVFPYNLMRTWHVQLALFWVATSFVAAGHLPGADDRPARAQAPGQARLRAARRARRRRVRHADRLLPRHPRRARGRRLELVRPAGLRVPRPRAAVAGPAVDRAVRLGLHALARPAPAAGAPSTRATCRGCSSWRRARSPPSTPSG